MDDWLGRAAPDLEAIDRLARSTLAELPGPFAGPAPPARRPNGDDDHG